MKRVTTKPIERWSKKNHPLVLVHDPKTEACFLVGDGLKKTIPSPNAKMTDVTDKFDFDNLSMGESGGLELYSISQTEFKELCAMFCSALNTSHFRSLLSTWIKQKTKKEIITK